jgi:hypothetical protein
MREGEDWSTRPLGYGTGRPMSADAARAPFRNERPIFELPTRMPRSTPSIYRDRPDIRRYYRTNVRNAKR